mmetsp:Transcript_13713/g.25860  ORF Transcript_13713/g.25860 Transcript_13713/m.25860 type:complete len:133 (-) Transcript_13713:2042-2440(-)
MIVNASGLRAPQGLLSSCVDEEGFTYELPPYVLNPALEYGKTLERPVQAPPTAKGEAIEIKCRTTSFGDHDIGINTLEPVSAFKAKLGEKFALTLKQIRVFFNGREMKDEFVLMQYGVKDKNTVTVVTLPNT